MKKNNDQRTKDDLLRRLRRFSIGMEIINEKPLAVTQLMCGMLVFEAIYVYDTNQISYLAASPDFDVVPNGLSAPRYRVFWNGDRLVMEAKND